MNIATVIEHTSVINETLKKYGQRLIILNEVEYKKFIDFIEVGKLSDENSLFLLTSKYKIQENQISELRRTVAKLEKKLYRMKN